MPRQTAHPVRNLLGALGFNGSTEEAATPVGDTLQPTLRSEWYDPPYETFAVGLQVAAGAGHGRLRLWPKTGEQIRAIRVRSLTAFNSSSGTPYSLGSTLLPETADTISVPEGVFSSHGKPWPFNARGDLLVVAPATTHYWFGEGAVANWDGGLFLESPGVLELIDFSSGVFFRPSLVIDVMRSQGR